MRRIREVFFSNTGPIRELDLGRILFIPDLPFISRKINLSSASLNVFPWSDSITGFLIKVPRIPCLPPAPASSGSSGKGSPSLEALVRRLFNNVSLYISRLGRYVIHFTFSRPPDSLPWGWLPAHLKALLREAVSPCGTWIGGKDPIPFPFPAPFGLKQAPSSPRIEAA